MGATVTFAFATSDHPDWDFHSGSHCLWIQGKHIGGGGQSRKSGVAETYVREMQDTYEDMW